MDTDGDGYGPGCPAGDDCAPDNNLRFIPLTGAMDSDGDSFTFGPDIQFCTGGMLPQGFAPRSNQQDCNDADGSVSTGCGSCITLRFNARNWKFCADKRDRNPSAGQCSNAGMFLASIHSSQEEDFMEGVLSYLGGDFVVRTWIGLRESPTRWDDSSAVDFYDFNNGTMQGGSSAEHCVNVFQALSWDDDDCGGHQFPYVCATAPGAMP